MAMLNLLNIDYIFVIYTDFTITENYQLATKVSKFMVPTELYHLTREATCTLREQTPPLDATTYHPRCPQNSIMDPP